MASDHSPSTQAREVADMLGWTLDLESWHGVYFLAQDGCVTRSIKIPPAELHTLHRVLSEGKRARECLERCRTRFPLVVLRYQSGAEAEAIELAKIAESDIDNTLADRSPTDDS